VAEPEQDSDYNDDRGAEADAPTAQAGRQDVQETDFVGAANVDIPNVPSADLRN
jgi:hypothetical protein